MGYRSVRKTLGDYNSFVFYLDNGAVDLPIIENKTSILPGSEAHDLKTTDMWILNSEFVWEKCPWKHGTGNTTTTSDVTKSYVDNRDTIVYNNLLNYIKTNGSITYVSSLPAKGSERIIYGVKGADDSLTLSVFDNNTWHTIFDSKLSIDKWVTQHGTYDVELPYTKPEINHLLASIQNILVVMAEPASPMPKTLYYVGPQADGSYNVILYDSDSKRILLGSTEVNFSNYQTRNDDNLATTVKSIVGAINEVLGLIDDKQDATPAAGSLHTTADTIEGAINELVEINTQKKYRELADKTVIETIQGLVSSGFIAAYPVGSIYISMGVDPNTLAPGTQWVKIQNKFLLGSSNSVDHGATGGKSSVTLTTSELPKHNHGVRMDESGAHTHNYSHNSDVVSYSNGNKNGPTGGTLKLTTESSGSHKHNLYCDNAGSGNAFEILPPYIKVDIWQRTS